MNEFEKILEAHMLKTGCSADDPIVRLCQMFANITRSSGFPIHVNDPNGSKEEILSRELQAVREALGAKDNEDAVKAAKRVSGQLLETERERVDLVENGITSNDGLLNYRYCCKLLKCEYGQAGPAIRALQGRVETAEKELNNAWAVVPTVARGMVTLADSIKAKLENERESAAGESYRRGKTDERCAWLSHKLIAEEVGAAVAEEREACAKVCENEVSSIWSLPFSAAVRLQHAAAHIRARSGSK